MYIKENQRLKFQFILAEAKHCLGSSVLNYQAEEQRFWADPKAWEQMPKALPSPILINFRPKLMFFQQKSLHFSVFQQFSQTNFSVPDLTGLMERF